MTHNSFEGPERVKRQDADATELLLKRWASEGMIVEGGWIAFAEKNLRGASDEQIQEMRKAWMLGAQHLCAILLHLADSNQKVKYVDLITQELKEFQRFYLKAQESSSG